MLVVLLLGRGYEDNDDINISVPCDSAATAKIWKEFYATRGWRNLHITGWMHVESFDQSIQAIAKLSQPTAEDEAFDSIPGALTL